LSAPRPKRLENSKVNPHRVFAVRIFLDRFVCIVNGRRVDNFDRQDDGADQPNQRDGEDGCQHVSHPRFVSNGFF
jgi:hypothetical protein